MIDIQNISRMFKDKKTTIEAVKDVSFQIKKGDVVGLLGENGAGKTPLLRMLSTILDFGKKESDAIKKGVSSSKIGSLEVRKRISMIKWTKEEQVEELVKEIEINMKEQFNNLLMEVTL